MGNISVDISGFHLTNHRVGETGYGCHTFYITDVFRNIVIFAETRHLLCLNIISCAHIDMHFLFIYYFIRNNIFLLIKKTFSRVTIIPMLGLLVTTDGLVVTRYDTAYRRRIS